MPNEIQLPPGDGTPQPARLVSYQPGPGPFHYVEMPDDGSFRETPGGLAEYWQILRRRKGALVLAAFAGALMALLVTLPQTPVYRGETSIEVLGINENFLNMRDVNPNSTGGAAYPPEYDIQTQVRILQSRPLLETVVRKTNLAQRMASVRPPRVLSAVRKALGSEQPPLSPAEQALNMAVRDLKIRTQPNTRVIEIWYDSTDPRLAAEFANTLANEFIEYNLRERWATSQHTSDWLTRQLEALKTKLEKSEAQLQSYARRSGLVITSETGNVTEERLRQIQDELSKAQADRIVRQSQYELATQASPDSLPQVLEDPGLREYHNKLTELRRQLAELTSTLTPAHPKVIKLEAQIKTLQSALERARANIIDRIRNEYAAARRREKLLAGDYERQTRHISAEAARLSRYSLLKREVDTTRQLYDSLLQRVKEASLASALRATNIRVIEAAEPPKVPYKPRPALNSVLGLLLGGVLGMGFIVFRERMNRSFQEPGDAHLCLGVNEIGVIPSAYADRERNFRLRGLKAVVDAGRRLNGSVPAGQTTGSGQVELVAWNKPSVVADSFRLVLTSILFGDRHGSPRVIVLSSANPKEGKTTVISNLAVAIAEANQRVLLIDGDMRRPRIHEIFGVENGPGVADLLRELNPLDAASVKRLVRASGIPNLSLLTSGHSDLAAMNLVYSPRLEEAVHFLRQDYDIVLIDSPPALQMADARVLARCADAVILVVRAQRTMRDAAKLACERFAQDGTHIFGAILNDWEPQESPSYAYRKYYDHYHSYYGGKRE